MVRGAGDAGVVVTYHDGITVERSDADKPAGNTGMCTCRRKRPTGGIRRAIRGVI